MRDSKRIKLLLEQVEIMWNKYPDLRFGQLIEIIKDMSPLDLFYIEDNALLKIIQSSNNLKNNDNNGDQSPSIVNTIISGLTAAGIIKEDKNDNN